VIHDFAIPIFRIKKDVVPGRYTTEWFEATKVGTGWIFCDQYCGTQHSKMVGKVTVMTAGDYQAWLSGQIRGLTPVEAGQELFKQYSCVNCHSQQAPTMANLYGSKVKVWEDGKLIEVLADEDYITDSILYPNHQIVEGYQPLMPSFKGRLSAEQLQQLVSYIKSLGIQGGRVDSLKMNNRYVPAGPIEPADRGGLTK
jgi:cytochrome c oxidase subunit 2